MPDSAPDSVAPFARWRVSMADPARARLEAETSRWARLLRGPGALLAVVALALVYQLPFFDRWFSFMDEGHILLFADIIANGGELYGPASDRPGPHGPLGRNRAAGEGVAPDGRRRPPPPVGSISGGRGPLRAGGGGRGTARDRLLAHAAPRVEARRPRLVRGRGSPGRARGRSVTLEFSTRTDHEDANNLLVGGWALPRIVAGATGGRMP